MIANENGDLPHLISGDTVTYVKDIEELRWAWQRMITDEDYRNERMTRSRKVTGMFDGRVSHKRWEWLIRSELGEGLSGPAVTIGVVHGMPFRKYLENCLDSLVGQTYPVRIVVLHDVSIWGDPGVEDWLRDNYPQVECRTVKYDSDKPNRSFVRNALLDVAPDGVLVWLDGDCIVAQDFIERIAACFAVEDNPFVIFPRYHCKLPERLPEVMLEASMHHALEVLPERYGKLDKNEVRISAMLADESLRSKLWLGTGPATAVRVGTIRWDDSMLGWGAEECEIGLEILRGGGKPMLGPRVYHQIHPVLEQRRMATNLKNLGGVFMKYDVGRVA